MAAHPLQIAKKLIGKQVELILDCPLGSRNSQQGYTYETNYGFVKGVTASNGGKLHAYFVGTNQALREATGRCIAIIYSDERSDVRLVVATPGITLTQREIAKLVNYQEQWSDSKIFHR
jgi:inorganic pyrophosphatase